MKISSRCARLACRSFAQSEIRRKSEQNLLRGIALLFLLDLGGHNVRARSRKDQHAGASDTLRCGGHRRGFALERKVAMMHVCSRRPREGWEVQDSEEMCE